MFVLLFGGCDIGDFESALESKRWVSWLAFLRSDVFVPVLTGRRMEFKLVPHGRKNVTVNDGFACLEFEGKSEG